MPLVHNHRLAIDSGYGVELTSDKRGSARFDFLSLERIGTVLHPHGNVTGFDFRDRDAIPFVSADESSRKLLPVKRILSVFDGKGNQASFDFRDTGSYPS